MNEPLIPESATVVVAADVLVSDFADEVVILNLRDGVYYGLEEVGARIWQLLQHPVTVTDICGALLSEYDLESERCISDVRALVTELAAKGLVEIREAP